MVLSPFLEAGSPKGGVELELQARVAELLVNPLGVVVGFKDETEDSGA